MIFGGNSLFAAMGRKIIGLSSGSKASVMDSAAPWPHCTLRQHSQAPVLLSQGRMLFSPLPGPQLGGWHAEEDGEEGARRNLPAGIYKK